MDVVSILNDFLRTSGFDANTVSGSKAYKLDEAAKWAEWGWEVELKMSNLIGPEAPHYFQICRRRHVGTGGPGRDGVQELRACASADDRGYAPSGDDVVLIVKDRMSSLEVSQIVLLVPGQDLPRLCCLSSLLGNMIAGHPCRTIAGKCGMLPCNA